MANQWLTGTGTPSLGIGQVTDYYRDTVNNLVYYRENAFTWVVVPAFTPNPDGIGTTWLHGNVPPLTGQGSDGDYYYDEVQLIIYRKDGATWVPKGSLDFIGIYGVQWGNGLGAPANTTPLNNLPAGSFYLDVITSDIYFKPPSMTWELKGQLGGGGGGGGGSSINLITTLEEVAELDVTSAVTPSVIYDLDILKADLASPIFTGTPTAPTPQTEPSLDNSTKLATTEFVHNVVANYTAFPRYDQAQTLTDVQKSQILTNIGAKKSYNLINKTASYALALTDFQNDVDLYDKVYLRMNVATANNVTIGTALSSLPNLSEISVRNVGAGFTTLVASGTTLNGILVFSVVNEVKTLIKVGVNEWDVIGALT